MSFGPLYEICLRDCLHLADLCPTLLRILIARSLSLLHLVLSGGKLPFMLHFPPSIKWVQPLYFYLGDFHGLANQNTERLFGFFSPRTERSIHSCRSPKV